MSQTLNQSWSGAGEPRPLGKPPGPVSAGVGPVAADRFPIQVPVAVPVASAKRIERPAPLGARAPAESGEPGMLFFGANRRSGTTWLASILNAHPEVSCRNEGWLLTDKDGSADKWLDKNSVDRWCMLKAPRGTYVRHLGAAGVERALRRGMVRELVKQAVLAEGWKDYSKLKWMGDKTTTHYCTHVEFLHDVFPDARYLYMLRDGRDVVVSDMFLKFRDDQLRMDPDLSLEQVRDIERAREYHYYGRGKPVPLFTRETMRFFAGNWVECVSGGLRAQELYGAGGGFFQVRYEEMVADSTACVRSVYEWLGVRADEAAVARAVDACKWENFSEGRARGEADPKAEWRKGISGDWPNFFSQDDKDMFKRIAGGLLVQLGYASDLSW